jgi:phage FluMu gp28-like protein
MREEIPVVRWEMPPEFAQRSEIERTREAADFCNANIAPFVEHLDLNAMSCFAEDFGRSGDLTVIWPLQMRNNLLRRTPFVVELRNIPFRQQEQVLFYIVDRLPRFVGGAMDARGNGQYLAETAMQRYGQRIRQLMLSADWYRENMPRYRAAFEDGRIELPRDADILADHRSLVMENGIAHVPERRARGVTGKPRHGDSAIAGALAYYASKLSPTETAYRPAPRRHANPDLETPGAGEPLLKDLQTHSDWSFGAGAW